MFQNSTAGLAALLTTYGYWAVFACIAIESTGIPFPGETMLLVAAIYAGTTHQLSIVLVIAAAASGAILGDNLGFWVGREGGYRLLRRYGHLVHLNERKLKLGLYLFRRHGGTVVFFGRFVAVLRMWAAFLAGTHRMEWKRFLLFNALGGILWATCYGLGGYLLGDHLQRLTGPLGLAALVLAGLGLCALFVFVRHNKRRLEEEAERALPGPLERYYPGAEAQRGRPVWEHTDLSRRVACVTGDLPRSLLRHAAQERGKRRWMSRPLVSAGMMALGMLACACGIYLHIAIHYHERAYAVLALGAVLFLAGVFGRYRSAALLLGRRLSHPLCYGVLALGMLTALAGLFMLSARSHTSVFRFLAIGLQKLSTHAPEVLFVLVAVGACGLLAGIVGLYLVKATRQASLH